jgi:hypothetical protein
MTVHDYIYLAAAVIVGVIGTARIVRLVTSDTWPPSVRLRIWWEDHTKGGWEKLLTCPWCFGPYATAVALAWFLLSGDNDLARTLWWVFYGWLAASYAVSWTVFHDED